MRICFVADGGSPLTQNWLRYFVRQGHEVHVVSSYPCPSFPLPVASLLAVPVAFSAFAAEPTAGRIDARRSLAAQLRARLKGGPWAEMRMAIRNSVGPLEVYRHAGRVRDFVRRLQPDLVHAMRIPFEGMLAAVAVRDVPLLISVWGNDFTLHAARYPLVRWQTRRAIERADALHCDCDRDRRLAQVMGFASSKPCVVLPGSGGVQLEWFHTGAASAATLALAQVSPDTPVVLNPRGFRDYVRNEAFFRAIPLVLQRRPEVVFVCSGMQGNPVVGQWIARLGIERSVRLLPAIGREGMADVFRLAQVSVSPSVHDGTPNTLLEAMACGAFPVAGDIESLREWITDGHNGLLCDPTDAAALARTMLRALDDAALRDRARPYNSALVAQRAEYGTVMSQVEHFYRQVVGRASSRERCT